MIFISSNKQNIIKIAILQETLNTSYIFFRFFFVDEDTSSLVLIIFIHTTNYTVITDSHAEIQCTRMQNEKI